MIFGLILLVIIICVVISCVKVVRQAQALVIERLGGGDLTPMLDGNEFPMYRAVLVKEGQTLSFAGARNGCRGSGGNE